MGFQEFLDDLTRTEDTPKEDVTLEDVLRSTGDMFRTMHYPKVHQTVLAQRGESERQAEQLAYEEEQAKLGRVFTTSERAEGEQFKAGESLLGREHLSSENLLGRLQQTGMQEAGFGQETAENKLNRELRESEGNLDRLQQTKENLESRMGQAIESMRARGSTEQLAELERNYKTLRDRLDRELKRELAKIKALQDTLKAQKPPYTLEETTKLLTGQLKTLDDNFTFVVDKSGQTTGFIKDDKTFPSAQEGYTRLRIIRTYLRRLGVDAEVNYESTWGENDGFRVTILGLATKKKPGDVLEHAGEISGTAAAKWPNPDKPLGKKKTTKDSFDYDVFNPAEQAAIKRMLPGKTFRKAGRTYVRTEDGVELFNRRKHKMKDKVAP